MHFGDLAGFGPSPACLDLPRKTAPRSTTNRRRSPLPDERTNGGFEELIRFLQATRELKAKALALGEAGWRAESVAREERVVEGGGGVVERMTEVE